MLLLIHLERFQLDQDTGCTLKLRTRVDVPLRLTVGGVDYRLYAQVRHVGEFAARGHYVAVTRQLGVPNAPWLQFNDGIVSAVDPARGRGRRGRAGRGADATIVASVRGALGPARTRDAAKGDTRLLARAYQVDRAKDAKLMLREIEDTFLAPESVEAFSKLVDAVAEARALKGGAKTAFFKKYTINDLATFQKEARGRPRDGGARPAPAHDARDRGSPSAAAATATATTSNQGTRRRRVPEADPARPSRQVAAAAAPSATLAAKERVRRAIAVAEATWTGVDDAPYQAALGKAAGELDEAIAAGEELRVKALSHARRASKAPAWLTRLTWIELRIIVPVTVALSLESMKGLGLKAKGNVAAFLSPMDIAATLPRRRERPAPRAAAYSGKAAKRYVVRKPQVMEALSNPKFGVPHGGLDAPGDGATVERDGRYYVDRRGRLARHRHRRRRPPGGHRGPPGLEVCYVRRSGDGGGGDEPEAERAQRRCSSTRLRRRGDGVEVCGEVNAPATTMVSADVIKQVARHCTAQMRHIGNTQAQLPTIFQSASCAEWPAIVSLVYGASPSARPTRAEDLDGIIAAIFEAYPAREDRAARDDMVAAARLAAARDLGRALEERAKSLASAPRDAVAERRRQRARARHARQEAREAALRASGATKTGSSDGFSWGSSSDSDDDDAARAARRNLGPEDAAFRRAMAQAGAGCDDAGDYAVDGAPVAAKFDAEAGGDYETSLVAHKAQDHPLAGRFAKFTFGDAGQLPPVLDGNPAAPDAPDDSGPAALGKRCFRSSFDEVLALNVNMRAEASAIRWVRFLQRMRRGECTRAPARDSDQDLLNGRALNRLPPAEQSVFRGAARLCPRNKSCMRENIEHAGAGKSARVLVATWHGRHAKPGETFQLVAETFICIGMLMAICVNFGEFGPGILVNGMRGRVVSWLLDAAGEVEYVVLDIPDYTGPRLYPGDDPRHATWVPGLGAGPGQPVKHITVFFPTKEDGKDFWPPRPAVPYVMCSRAASLDAIAIAEAQDASFFADMAASAAAIAVRELDEDYAQRTNDLCARYAHRLEDNSYHALLARFDVRCDDGIRDAGELRDLRVAALAFKADIPTCASAMSDIPTVV
ncbi:hypothetical protein JL720_17145 [Aureococcus anophagefferens]|nr:hypothetical protein JL720_17145 [Aureococcus anophagefferens]